VIFPRRPPEEGVLVIRPVRPPILSHRRIRIQRRTPPVQTARESVLPTLQAARDGGVPRTRSSGLTDKVPPRVRGPAGHRGSPCTVELAIRYGPGAAGEWIAPDNDGCLVAFETISILQGHEQVERIRRVRWCRLYWVRSAASSRGDRDGPRIRPHTADVPFGWNPRPHRMTR
jgi:hypothetical protein